MNKDVPSYDINDPIDRPQVIAQRDEQECKHYKPRYLYSDYAESNNAVDHDCDMVICCDCGATIEKCKEVGNE